MQASRAETRVVDAFALGFIKHERQLRKLFSFTVFQFPCFSSADEGDLRRELSKRRDVYAAHFVHALDVLWPNTVAEIIGPDYRQLDQQLVAARDVRDKVFHGQVTGTGISATVLESYISALRRWCELLGIGATREVGYDGFERNSYQKSKIQDVYERFAWPIESIDQYIEFIDDMVLDVRLSRTIMAPALLRGRAPYRSQIP